MWASPTWPLASSKAARSERESANKTILCGVIIAVTFCHFAMFNRQKQVTGSHGEEIKQGCENQETGAMGGHTGVCPSQTLKLGCCFRVIPRRVEGVRPLCHPIEPSLDVGSPRKGHDLG